MMNIEWRKNRRRARVLFVDQQPSNDMYRPSSFAASSMRRTTIGLIPLTFSGLIKRLRTLSANNIVERKAKVEIQRHEEQYMNERKVFHL
jgi:hypothetical protein